MLNGKRFDLTKPTVAHEDAVRQRSKIVVQLILLFGFSLCAYSEPVLITSGHLDVALFDVGFSFVGDGFQAQGNDDVPGSYCGFCPNGFSLINPMPFQVNAVNGILILGDKSYVLPSLAFMGTSPWARGFVFLRPQGTLPTITAAGTYDVAFAVGGSFCVTDDPQVAPPFPPDPGNPDCFSVLGGALAHYTVFATSTPDWFFQPIPTIEIVPVPEPGTLGAAMLALVLILATKYRTMRPAPSAGFYVCPHLGALLLRSVDVDGGATLRGARIRLRSHRLSHLRTLLYGTLADFSRRRIASLVSAAGVPRCHSSEACGRTRESSFPFSSSAPLQSTLPSPKTNGIPGGSKGAKAHSVGDYHKLQERS